MANRIRRLLLICGAFLFFVPNFSRAEGTTPSVRREVGRQLKKFRKELQTMTDWAEKSGEAILNGKPIPLAPGGLPLTQEVLDQFIDIMKQSVAAFRIPIPTLAQSAIHQPVASDSRRHIRSALRNSTKAALEDAVKVEEVSDHVQDIRDWSADVDEVAVALRQAAETLEHIYRLYPEYNLKVKIGITVLNLVDTSSSAKLISNDASDLARDIERKLSPIREELKRRKGVLIESLRKEQMLLRSDLEDFEHTKKELEARTRTKLDMDQQVEDLNSRITRALNNKRIFESKVEDCDEIIPGLNREVERLRRSYKAEEDKANESFKCPAGHTSEWVCKDVEYSSAWGQRVNSARKRRDDYKDDLDAKFSKLRMVEKEREEAYSRVASVKEQLNTLRRDFDDKSYRRNAFAQELIRDTKKFWAEAYENMASANSQESRADETNLVQSL